MTKKLGKSKKQWLKGRREAAYVAETIAGAFYVKPEPEERGLKVLVDCYVALELKRFDELFKEPEA